MLVEKSINEALMDYTKGKNVVIVQQFSDGTFSADSLNSFLEGENIHYIVDVPAVENPEFAQAVKNIMQSAEQLAPAKDPTEESSENFKIVGVENTEPTVKNTIKQQVQELARQGLTNSEIVKKTGFKYQSVYLYAKEVRDIPDIIPGSNADRQKCKTCIYRATDNAQNNCDFIAHTGKSRGCAVEDCDKYEKGPRMKLKNEEGA